ncbi:MAG: tRNA uridine-5-carboxymethylaminomethyl(34) synthesis GTPase MnmE, partial [Muribaculaceae bacterium]|nr:tRNA uridine-5-carboxymethylaminomethyl(34) synthesis GTPase MnmE [Muribaculaceae bacterium]
MYDSIYNPEDTICAVSTPPGHGGIAVIRLSGKAAMSIADSVWRGVSLTDAKSHTAHLGMVVDSEGSILDECVATLFRAPKSYTGEDTVEFSVHGSRWIQKRIIEVLCKAGARIALRGEFTRRAYSAGHLDLAQAEGVADLIGAGSKAAHDAALRQMRGGISQKLEK